MIRDAGGVGTIGGSGLFSVRRNGVSGRDHFPVNVAMSMHTLSRLANHFTLAEDLLLAKAWSGDVE